MDFRPKLFGNIGDAISNVPIVHCVSSTSQSLGPMAVRIWRFVNDCTGRQAVRYGERDNIMLSRESEFHPSRLGPLFAICGYSPNTPSSWLRPDEIKRVCRHLDVRDQHITLPYISN